MKIKNMLRSFESKHEKNFRNIKENSVLLHYPVESCNSDIHTIDQ